MLFRISYQFYIEYLLFIYIFIFTNILGIYFLYVKHFSHHFGCWKTDLLFFFNVVTHSFVGPWWSCSPTHRCVFDVNVFGETVMSQRYFRR